MCSLSASVRAHLSGSWTWASPTAAPPGRALLGFCNITVRKRDFTKCANDHPVGELIDLCKYTFFGALNVEGISDFRPKARENIC